jgi:FtsH-binding integral membrane protein
MKFNSEIGSGLAISLTGFLWLLMEYALGLHDKYITYDPFIFWMVIIIPIIGIYWAIKAKRDRYYEGKITFLQALKTGGIITAVVSIITPLFTWLYVAVVNDKYFIKHIDHERKMIQDLGLDDPSIFEQRLIEANQKYSTLHYLFNSFLFAFIVCAVLTIIVAALIRRNALPRKDHQPSESVSH